MDFGYVMELCEKHIGKGVRDILLEFNWVLDMPCTFVAWGL